MRKKLLLKSTGFEKPGSREEAIMQNILGASNVLEPAESNIEEILQSILYNIPYTKEAEFEIEKILLAIKNNSPYDGDGDSRDMRILIAILNDLDYTEGTESRIEELFVEWLHQRSKANVLEGVPPLTFVAKGNPLINYEISGNTVQTGTPTPDSPIEPEFVGDKTENLFDPENCEVGLIAPDGSIRTTATQSFSTDFVEIPEGATYATLSQEAVISSPGTNNYLAIARYREDKTLIQRNYEYVSTSDGVSKNILISSDAKYIRASIVASEPGANALSVKPMLNWGTEALPYEPYGYKLPISSGGQTNNIYLGQVQTTRKIKKLVLTGEETNLQKSRNREHTFEILNYSLRGICSHYSEMSGRDIDVVTGIYTNTTVTILVTDLRFTDLNDFKSYLAEQNTAGTPVTVWYVPRIPETAVVNEPLAKIGDYADSVNFSQAGVEIPTVSGSNTLDVNTTVKPSNIYIEYK